MSLQNFHYADYENSFNDVPATAQLANGAKAQTYANKVVHQRRGLVSVQPSSAVSSTFASIASTQIDYRLENNLDRLSNAWLRVKYTNNSGANFTVGPADSWLQRIEIYSNNGSTLLYQTLSNIELFASNILLSRDEWDVMATSRFSSPTYGTGVTNVPTGQTGYGYIPIGLLFFSSIHFRSYTVDGNLLVRIQWSNGPSFIQAGTCDINECVLLLSGFYESDAQKQLMMGQATLPKVLPYYAIMRHYETLNLNPSSQYNVRLSGIVGDAALMIFGLRSSTFINSPNNQFNFQPIEDFDLYDNANTSRTGFKRQTTEDMKLLVSHQFPNVMIDYTNLHVWSFSQTPIADIGKGSVNGIENFDGFHSLSFTTPASIVAGSFQLTVLCYTQQDLRILNAQMTSSRS